MRLLIAFGLVGMLLVAGGAQGATAIRSADSITPEDLPQLEVISSDAGGVSLVFDLPALAMEPISVRGEEFQEVEIPGGSLAGEVGHPAIPTFTRFVAIPDDAGVVVTSVIEEESEFSGIRLVPMQGDDGVEFAFDEAAYSVDAFQARSPAALGAPAISRDLRVVAVTFSPVQFNPATQTLRVSERMRVDITFEGQDLRNVRTTNRRSIPPSFDRIYQELVVNYAGPPRGMSVQAGTYLLICPNDAGVISRLQPLIEWRERMGYSVLFATDAQTGTAKEQILAYIQGVYNTADPPLEYVALAGDATTPYRIRTWYENVSGYSGEGDDPYTKLEGNDVLSDIHIGRLSFDTFTELETIVAKIVGYESAPYLGDQDWFTHACLVGDPRDSGESTVHVQQWIKRRIRQIGYTDIDTIFVSPFVSQMTSCLNDGASIFSYRGFYGMSGWTNSNTYGLTNGWKLPFVVTITCDTGSFASGTARSEGFLQAGSATTPKGGIGAIATSTTGTHTRYNNCLHYGIYRGLIYEGSTTMGAALTRGKYELYLNFQESQPSIVIIWSHWGNLMGDPAVDCWMGYPDPLTVDAPSTIPVGASAVTVAVEEGGQPSVDAQVCLHRDGAVHSVGSTDAQGAIELPVSALTEGQMLLTVTKHNRHPHLATIPVVGENSYLGYFASTVDDDDNGESSGNGDALVNPGETIELNVQVKNFGNQIATDVTATLTTNDPYVSISDNSETYGSIAPGGVGGSTDDFDLSVDLACPHNHTIRLGLDISSEANVWHALIDLPVVSADLQASGDYSLYNVGGNGRIDPGETGQLSVELVNLGGASAVNPTARLLSMSEYVSVPDPDGGYSTIGVGGTGENTSQTFTIEVAAECYEGYDARLQLLLEFSGGALDTTSVMVPVAVRESNDPIGPDAYGYYAFDNTDTAYPEAPTYNWIEIDPNFGGSGTQVPLHDYGDYEDDSEVVNLPFPFQYYGKTYTKATICSNGWVSMGSTWTVEYRNWTIPGAGGPEAMIAPFWDDLWQVQYGDSDIFQYHDQANHRWIVEWSRVRNDRGNYEETFQMILYDPAYYPTDTGDGMILFQYLDVTNSDSVDAYATVGIENEDQSIGVLYTFHNDYPAGAATLVDGRAIKFVPKREVLSGMIHGTVRNATAGGLPIGRAMVTVIETENEYQTDQDGTYEIMERAGTYSLFAAHEGFEPDTVSGVEVEPGGTVEINFGLIDITPPSIMTTVVETTNDSLGPYPVNVVIEDASPLEENYLYYRVNEGTFEQLELGSLGGDSYRASIPGQPWSSKVEYYIQAMDVGDNVATDPPGAPSETFVFFVAPTVSIFLDEMELEGGWTVGSPDDDATQGLWVRVDPNGTYDGEEPVQPEDDHTADPGTMCWVTGNAPPGSEQYVQDVDGGKTTLTSPPLYLEVEGVVVLRYYRWYTNDTGQLPGEDPWVVQVSDDDGQTWVDLENTDVSDRTWRLMEFDLSDYISLTNQVRVRFVAEDSEYFATVEAAIDDIEILFTGIYQKPADVEERMLEKFGLGQNTPNPFNPYTTIHFSIESASPTRLIVYDVQGRILRRLVDGVRSAGSHAVVWDGRDGAGHAVPSGIYLYRLESGAQSQTRKMILLQ